MWLQGDSGGPLVCECEVAYGVVSCGTQDLKVYTKIPDYLDWIERHIRKKWLQNVIVNLLVLCDLCWWINRCSTHLSCLLTTWNGIRNVEGENEKELKLSKIAYILCFRVCVRVNLCVYVLFLMHLNLVETKSTLFKTWITLHYW